MESKNNISTHTGTILTTRLKLDYRMHASLHTYTDLDDPSNRLDMELDRSEYLQTHIMERVNSYVDSSMK